MSAELTEPERETLRGSMGDVVGHPFVSVVAVVESILTARLAEAWGVAAARRGEGRRYYVAWQVARMRAHDLHNRLATVEAERDGWKQEAVREHTMRHDTAQQLADLRASITALAQRYDTDDTRWVCLAIRALLGEPS